MNAIPTALDSEVVDFLQQLKRRGVQLGLERMQRFMTALDYPERRVPLIHIAGTNGKGSVAAMLEAILSAAGWRTGLYTSPHLVRLGERIQVERRPLANDELNTAVNELRSHVQLLVERHGVAAQPSYFEFMTALAFRHFAASRCEVAVIECGMGGRLDATNVVEPEVSVITSIGLDHTAQLGGSLEAIAAEKAGIIKPARPVVIGRLPESAERVIRVIAQEREAGVCSVSEAFGPDVSTYPATNLEGDYQRVNAATATLAARQLAPRWRINDELIAHGLRRVDWPGRWQRLTVGDRLVVIDASHNAEGAAVLERNLARLAAEVGRAPLVVCGVLGADRARPLLEVLRRQAREIFLVVPNQPRACSHAELEALLPAGFGGPVRRSSVEQIFPAANTCLPERSRDDVVVVTGSIYLAGEVLARIDPSRGPAEPELQDF